MIVIVMLSVLQVDVIIGVIETLLPDFRMYATELDACLIGFDAK